MNSLFDTFVHGYQMSESQSEFDDRYSVIHDLFLKNFSCNPTLFCSLPGRIEVIGNHLDHSSGEVIAASIQLDIRCLASKNNQKYVRCISRNTKDVFSVELDNKLKYRMENTSESLIAGVCEWFRRKGYVIGGIDVCIDSKIPVGMGLSSSAAFSCCIALILSHVFNDDALTPMDICLSAQFAESVFMNKPCGLMDQIASVYGGLNHISFRSEIPQVEGLKASLDGWSCIVSTLGDGHGGKAGDYAEISNDMTHIAELIGVKRLGDQPLLLEHTQESWAKVFKPEIIKNILEKYSVRALLRTMHFVQECARVRLFKAAVISQDIFAMKSSIRASGISSWTFLQNVTSPQDSGDYAWLLGAVQTVDSLLDSASRVHGGGFGGSVISFLEREHSHSFRKTLTTYCPNATSMVAQIRPFGARAIRL